MDKEVHYADGDWHVVTLGGLVQLLIDAGTDVAATLRVIEDTPPDENNQFIRHMEIKLLPNGMVLDEARKECKTMSKILKKLCEEGIVR